MEDEFEKRATHCSLTETPQCFVKYSVIDQVYGNKKWERKLETTQLS